MRERKDEVPILGRPRSFGGCWAGNWDPELACRHWQGHEALRLEDRDESWTNGCTAREKSSLHVNRQDAMTASYEHQATWYPSYFG